MLSDFQALALLDVTNVLKSDWWTICNISFLFADTKASTHDFLSLYGKGSQQAENGSSAGMPQLVVFLPFGSIVVQNLLKDWAVFVDWFIVSYQQS